MGNAIAVTSDTFDSEVLQSSVPVLVDFWAAWCGPCRMIAPYVEAVAEEFAGQAKVAKVDVDSNQDLAMRYGIMGIPALLIFKGGQVVEQMVGARGKDEIADTLRRHVG
ncbi:MAG: thioredoxin [Fimbriimonadales bacterium]